jgi:hypothetical protein
MTFGPQAPSASRKGPSPARAEVGRADGLCPLSSFVRAESLLVGLEILAVRSSFLAICVCDVLISTL